MIRDLLRLDIDTELFFRQSLGDLEFICSTLDTLIAQFLSNTKLINKEQEADNLSDAEWQFNQLLSEFNNNSSPFTGFKETSNFVALLREKSVIRQKKMIESHIPQQRKATEPVVSQAEMSGLLGSAVF